MPRSDAQSLREREDLGFIPSFADWVKAIRPEPWMGRAAKIELDVEAAA